MTSIHADVTMRLRVISQNTIVLQSLRIGGIIMKKMKIRLYIPILIILIILSFVYSNYSRHQEFLTGVQYFNYIDSADKMKDIYDTEKNRNAEPSRSEGTLGIRAGITIGTDTIIIDNVEYIDLKLNDEFLIYANKEVALSEETISKSKANNNIYVSNDTMDTLIKFTDDYNIGEIVPTSRRDKNAYYDRASFVSALLGFILIYILLHNAFNLWSKQPKITVNEVD